MMLDKITLKGKEVQMSDEEFFRFCMANPELKIERNAQQEIVIMSPTNSKTGSMSLKIGYQLEVWNERSGLGVSFDSSTGFSLPDGSVMSPDASWLPMERWQQLSADEKERFAPVCPLFVVELKSKTDKLKDLQEKMDNWLRNGTQLGWLILPEEERVYIYRPGQAVQQHLDFQHKLSADPVLPGFAMDLIKLRVP